MKLMKTIHSPLLTQLSLTNLKRLLFTRICICLSVLSVAFGMQAKTFVHPGVMHTTESLERMKASIAKKEYPAYGSYKLLKDHHCSKSDYEPFGPFEVIARDGEFRHTKSKMEQDFSAAYQNSLMWALSGDEAHAKKAVEILLGYARTLKRIPDTNDAPLLAGLEGWKIAYATEMLRHTYKGLTDDEFTEIIAMIKNVFIPVMEKFYSRKAYTNGNWGPIVTKAYMASAILLDDEEMYGKAKEFYLHADDNGTIANYIDGVTGQIQESGRDQGHCQLGIGAMATVCEMAWAQGDDLYGALDNRLLKGFEYVAKYNLGKEVPFRQWKDITGKYCDWPVVSPHSRGSFKPVYEMAYNHYVNRKGLKMPYTERVLSRIRPEGFERDQPSFGSLLFYEGTPQPIKVHAYEPLSVSANGPAGPYPSHVRSEAASSRYGVVVEDSSIPVIEYDNTGFGNQGHNIDVARFASNSFTPKVTISILDDILIDSVTIHPAVFYPKETIEISPDGRSLCFSMDERLPYAIVTINGADPQDVFANGPQLAIINDPLETSQYVPDPSADNVLDFKSFAEEYVKSHPVTDKVGEICREAGSVSDESLNDGRRFVWNHGEGRFKDYEEKVVAFPDKRARNSNDLSDALQAALELIKNTPELNTLYIGPGVYLWSGLRIIDWNGDSKSGGKPLYVYTHENALMINRLKECRESLEPAILIRNSNHITISGRGMHDGQGCLTFSTDRKDARNTPHQGGVMLIKSSDITFNDTYLRDSQQWNWETHGVNNVRFNNIKGLSPYNHGWIDGLNFASGKNIFVDKSFTLGNDDTFATGHYNPSDEFPRRTYSENKTIDLENTDANSEEFKNTFAAAAVYNGDRLKWDIDDSENIHVNNALGWTKTANCIRAGSNTSIGNKEAGERGCSLRSYFFNNFHSVTGSKAMGQIRFQNGDHGCFPSYKFIEVRDCSFWTSSRNLIQIPAKADERHLIQKVIIDNVRFVKPVENPETKMSGIENLIINNLHIGGQKVASTKDAGISGTLERVDSFSKDFID